MIGKEKIVLLVFIFFMFNLSAQEFIYPKPEGVSPSPEYKVWVNGKEAFVYASPIPAAYCSFEMKGPVTITIKANRDVKWVDVKPFSSRIIPVFNDSIISFRIDKPRQLSLEVNGSIKTPLFLFANAPETDKPSKTNKNIIFFEAGKVYHAGSIELKTNQSVYIEGGAIVVGAIMAKDARHIKIYGRGILDGTWNNRFNDSLIRAGAFEKLPSPSDQTYRRFIEFNNCEDISVSGITLHNNTTWQLVPVGCRNVLVENIKIVSDQPSDDGIDVVHSRNVVIKNCFFRTKDDCVVIKAYMKGPAIQPVDSILVEHCVMWNALWGNALEIGFELNGVDVKNITFKDCDIIRVEAGAVMSIHNAGRSTVSNILFENIRIEDARQKLFDLAIFRSQYSEDGTHDPEERRKLYLNGAWDGVLMVPTDQKESHAQYRGQIRDVTFRNISIINGNFPFSIFSGFDKKHNVQNIKIENLTAYKRKINDIKEARFYLENSLNVTVR